jgi:atypical dual specificity phosphatase
MWWIDEPILAGGPNPTEAAMAVLTRAGFVRIVCLLDMADQNPAYDVNRAKADGFDWRHLGLPDSAAPTIPQIEEFLGMLGDGAKTYVHCQGGLGRTGTMAAAYWIARGLPAEAAIGKVRVAQPRAVETPAQTEQLKAFEQHLRAHGW